MTQNESISSPDYQTLPKSELIARIRVIKAQYGDNIVIPAHFYQKDEILALSDFHGDSFQLSTIAAKNEKAQAIFFCGVHFMAETADMLVNSAEKLKARQGKRVDVILPALNAGCTMADMADAEQIEACWSELGQVIDTDDITPITYINSGAALKAFCGKHGGASCTSSNAAAVLKWAFSRKKRVLFFPDQHLGRNTAWNMGIPESEIILWNHKNRVLFEQLTLLGKPCPKADGPWGGNSPEQIKNCRVILWNGFCNVHQRFTTDDVARIRKEYPEAKIIVHPECCRQVVRQADLAGSTALILKEVEGGAPGSQWAVGTEWRMIEALQRLFPDKTILNLSSEPRKCESMDQITLANLCEVMEAWAAGKPRHIVRVPESIAVDSLKCLEQMLRCR
ncbi:MAG: quinolinate synthase NadA [Thermoguttaceae bacterium]|nr:quinolinate synthase NadA [Thermoguttaceae bacterium]